MKAVEFAGFTNYSSSYKRELGQGSCLILWITRAIAHGQKVVFDDEGSFIQDKGVMNRQRCSKGAEYTTWT